MLHKIAWSAAATAAATAAAAAQIGAQHRPRRDEVEELADLAHANDAILVVDGAQAPGGLNVNVSELGVDAYATSCHKWMLAPKGNGLLYIKKAVQPWVKSMMLAGGFTACESSSNDLSPRYRLTWTVATNRHGRDRDASSADNPRARARDELPHQLRGRDGRGAEA